MGETLSILLPVVSLSVVLQIASKLFVLEECPNFFCVAHFGVAILVFSARFGVAFYCFKFAFCSTTFVRPLSHLSTGFCHFRNFHTLFSHIFHTSLPPFFFINSCAFTNFLHFSNLLKRLGETLSILLPVIPLFVVH